MPDVSVIRSSAPDHDTCSPDIAVPLEPTPTFTIAKGQNQSIWSNIHMPKAAAAGIYKGAVRIFVGTTLSCFLPVELVGATSHCRHLQFKDGVYLDNDTSRQRAQPRMDSAPRRHITQRRQWP